MTEEQPHRALTERIAALEAAMTHMKDIQAYRERMQEDRFDRLDAHNRAQDVEAEKFATETKDSVRAINKLLWSGMSWLVCATGGLLLAAALKLLGIV